MAERGRRTESSAHPGAVVNNAKQKRRTPEEIARDRLEKEQAKAEKQRRTAEKKQSSVRRIAAVEDEIRQEDERARATAARPDLVTAQLKRSVAAQSQPEEAQIPILAGSTSMSSAHVDEDTVMSTLNDIGGALDTMEHDNSDDDPDYQDQSEDGRGDADTDDQAGDDDEQMEADDDEDIQAQVAAFAASLRKKKEKGKAPAKPKKGQLRTEIKRTQGSNPTGTKRRLPEAEQPEPSQPAKKPKAAAGGLKPNWQKEVGVPKLAKKSTTSWNRSASRASSTSATSGISASSAVSSPGPGEFDQEETEDVLQAARAAKGQGTRGTAATATMGITLTKKILTLNVDGRVKHETKRKYTNADLPFPAADFQKDLKHYKATVIPDLIEWAGTLPDPFAATSYPEFLPTLIYIWTSYFGGEHYKPTDAVQFMAGATIGNWRSAIGKRAIAVVLAYLNTLETAQERRKWVAEQLHDLAFLYRDPVNKTGSYRSSLFLSTFGGAHLRITFKTDNSYGHPTGAAAVTAAALERALTLCKDGSLSTQGLPRKGKKSIHSFGAVPWAQRAASYLPRLLELSTKKWAEIFSLAHEFTQSSGSGVDDLLDQSTDGEASDPGYVDPRSQIVISDDEPEDDDDDPAGPSRNSSAGHEDALHVGNDGHGF
ncbi:hypothetical protein DFH06DRAFT_1476250 [Mycena polygramma]|nr:hypothetical protein DFH06DRAFT_1476250 [Mycena polygramma]